MVKDTTKFIFGSFILLLGSLFLMINFDVFHISFWNVIDVFWPVGLILAGVLLMLRKKAFAIMIVIFTLVLALFSNIFIFENDALSELVVKNYNKELDNSTLQINYDFDFGAGELNVKAGSENELYNVNTSTYYQNKELNIKSRFGEGIKYVDFDTSKDITFNNLGELINFESKTENWDVLLNPSIPLELDIDLGATESLLDLSELIVKDLDLDFGASSVEIKFGEYPTKAKIDMGASELILNLPKDYPVLIEVDGGLISTEFEGFVKSGESYKTEKFKYDKEYISISIDAGASDIKTQFY